MAKPLSNRAPARIAPREVLSFTKAVGKGIYGYVRAVLVAHLMVFGY